MLAILSEINCLSVLNNKGVYPDEFYTDIEKFKKNTIFFTDATIIVIFAGNCHFNKKHTIELIKNLMKRADTASDKGISHVYVISDMTIAGLRSYYKYEGNIDTVSIMHGWSAVKNDVDIWKKLQNEPKKAKEFLSSYDEGVATDAFNRHNARYSKEDEYIKLIVVPDVKKMLSLS
jgi:hypothetical protein